MATDFDSLRLRLLSFVHKYTGHTVYFSALDDMERYSYVLLKGYHYFHKVMPVREALLRAKKNADTHKANGYSVFDSASERIKIGVN